VRGAALSQSPAVRFRLPEDNVDTLFALPPVPARSRRALMRKRAPVAPSWSLSTRADDDTRAAASTLPRRHVLAAVARRGLPGIIEASLVPSAIFLIVTGAVSATIAMIAVLVWGYTTILRRVVRGTGVPAVLVLAMFGLTVKT